MSAQHGTRLRIDAWLPMRDRSTAEYARISALIDELKNNLQLDGGEIIKCEDRVTSRREKP